jgi:4a-hydroxytetrahydrobiopterin dehydratase
MIKLDQSSVTEHLAALPAWQFRAERGGVIHREFRFAGFAEAFAFMAQVALIAERRNHHPEWSNVYNRVSISLTTHDVNGLSMNDIDLAHLIDRAFANFVTPVG